MRAPVPNAKGQVLDKPPKPLHSAPMKQILTFGDSNTHGTPPITQLGRYARYDPQIRWPGVMADTLGPTWTVIEEGLPGRTAQFDDPVMDGIMNGTPALRQALQSHGPLDVLTLMLGTNDTKTRFAASAETIAGGCAALLDLALGDEMQTRHGGVKVLLIAPPPITETGLLAAEFWGGSAKSRALAPLLRTLAQAKGAAFFDAGDIVSTSPVDGVHLDTDAHRQLGIAIARQIPAL